MARKAMIKKMTVMVVCIVLVAAIAMQSAGFAGTWSSMGGTWAFGSQDHKYLRIVTDSGANGGAPYANIITGNLWESYANGGLGSWFWRLYNTYGGTSSTQIKVQYIKVEGGKFNDAAVSDAQISSWFQPRAGINNNPNTVNTQYIFGGFNVSLTGKYTMNYFPVHYNSGANEASCRGAYSRTTNVYFYNKTEIDTLRNDCNAYLNPAHYTTASWNNYVANRDWALSHTNYWASLGSVATDYNTTAWYITNFAAPKNAFYAARAALQTASYNLTFDANGGTGGTGPTSTLYNAAISAPAVSRTNYTFAGWQPAVPANMPAADSTYTAQWNTTSYTITWAANGGTGGGTNSCDSGVTPTPIDAGTRTGYTFTGWDPAIVPAAGHTTYTAQWQANNYTVLYDGNGSTGGSTASSSHTYDTPKALTTNGFSRTGWAFQGWSTTPEGSAQYTNDQTVSNLTDVNGATVTLYAVWSQNNYAFYFLANGGEGGTSGTLHYGDPVVVPTVTRTGYTFGGWAEGTPPLTMPANTIVFTAVWFVHAYTVTYNGNGAENGSTADSAHTYDIPKALTNNGFTKTGFSFAGWSTTPGGAVVYANGESVSNLTGESNGVVTLYAQWSAIDYNFTFDANGGDGGTSGTLHYGHPVVVPTVTKTGYTFAGWGEGVPPTTMPAENIVYSAVWTRNFYTITYDGNGATSGSTDNSSHRYDTAKVLTTNGFTRIGAVFTGWSTTPGGALQYTNGQSVLNLTAVPNDTVTLYAVWYLIDYSITFNANGGTGGTSGTLHYGDPVIVPNVTRTGYTFTGWAEGTPPATMPAEDTTYTAQWNINSYTITWDANGGTGGGSNSCDYCAMPTPIDAGTKTGYTFAGWAPEVVAATTDATYTAQWTINSYTITWDGNGGTGGGQNSCDYGAMPTAIDAGTNSGFTFAGWDPAIAAATGDATYTAQWDAIPTSTITFDLNGGTSAAIDPITLEEGAAVTAPDDPTREGYIFAGWLPVVPTTMPVDDVTCVAQWTAANVTITFDANEGVGGWIMDLTIGDPLVAPEVTRYGYTFDGWDPEVPATVPGAAATYTAQWIEIQLIPGDNSTTVIDETNFFIYGLAEGISQEDFELLFVDILGDGRIEVTSADEGIIGTGTKVELIDNATNEVLAIYYVVIYGDVTGDGIVDAVDGDLIVNYMNFAVLWDPETEAYLYKAGDLNEDGNADAQDADIITNCQNFAMWIDQTTGIAYEY